MFVSHQCLQPFFSGFPCVAVSQCVDDPPFWGLHMCPGRRRRLATWMHQLLRVLHLFVFLFLIYITQYDDLKNIFKKKCIYICKTELLCLTAGINTMLCINYTPITTVLSFLMAQTVKNLLGMPWVGKIPWRKKRQPTPVFLPGKSCGQRSLAVYSPWGRKESDMTDWLTAISFERSKNKPGLKVTHHVTAVTWPLTSRKLEIRRITWLLSEK